MGKWALTLAFVAGCSSTTNYFVNVEGDASVVVDDDGGAVTPEEDAASDDADADGGGGDAAPDPADASDDSGISDAGGEVDAGACGGVVRYEIPKGSYAWAKKCSGFVLSTSVHDPPTETECKYEGSTLVDKCILWGANVIYFRPATGTTCGIDIFPIPVESAHSCSK